MKTWQYVALAVVALYFWRRAKDKQRADAMAAGQAAAMAAASASGALVSTEQ